MKLLLIDLTVDGYNVYPFGLYALKAYIQPLFAELAIEVRAFKCATPLEEIVAAIDTEEANIVGLSCFVWSVAKMFDLARQLRSQKGDRFVVLGGPQIEKGSTPLENLLLERIVDAAVIGEGERPLTDLLRGLLSEGVVRPGIDNVGVVDGATVAWGKDARLDKCIDYLPNPYGSLEDLQQLVAETGMAFYESSRGCPYSCTFCDQGAKNFRSHSMARIKQDLSEILALRPKKLLFLDSTFNASPGRTKEILRFLIEHGDGLEFDAEVKPERCDEEMIDMMRLAGLRSVEVGLQSTKKETLAFIKRSNNFKKIALSVQTMLSRGIDVCIDTIIGLPGDTLADWLATVDYCFSVGDVTIFSNTLKILPNAELKRDILDTEFRYSEARNCMVERTDAMSADDLEMARLHQKMVKLFWNRSSDRAGLRQVIHEKFDGKLTLFTRELMDLIGAGVDADLLCSPTFWPAYRPLIRAGAAPSAFPPRRWLNVVA